MRRLSFKHLPVASLAGALLFSGTAVAETGFYAGATAGQSQIDVNKGDVDEAVLFLFDAIGYPVVAGASDLDDSDVGFSGLLGYRFGSYFALEAAYIDLGEATYNATGTVVAPGGNTPVTINLAAGSKGPALSALGIWPATASWDLYARLGVYFADVELSLRASAEGLSDGMSESDSSEEIFFGAGVAYKFPNGLALRGEFTQFKDVGSDDFIGEADINFLSVGLTYTF